MRSVKTDQTAQIIADFVLRWLILFFNQNMEIVPDKALFSIKK